MLIVPDIWKSEDYTLLLQKIRVLYGRKKLICEFEDCSIKANLYVLDLRFSKDENSSLIICLF